MLKISRYSTQVKISCSASSDNLSASSSGDRFPHVLLNASCSLTRENIRSATALTEKNNVTPEKKQITTTAQPI
jgi:hypothetical protein